ncbi:MAG: HD domain-containing protein [Coriobacteriia bacterium]|nr:HD domain-containing protein [Coriobacteriia bacterium]MBN2822964.1 HD domain-containing protein [Coriobacteriia bacterium]
MKGTPELVMLDDVQADPGVLAYIRMGNDYLGALGYTEHGLRHANLVAHIAGNILRRLGYDERSAEVASIAGFMHDIGNCISREFHGVSAALLARSILIDLGMDFSEVAVVMNALGNHEEEIGVPATVVGAAVIMADKADVHHTRVRNTDPADFDIHDRVNYAAKRSFLRVDEETRTLTLEIDIDTEESQVMEYFEIFLSRMQICRKAADVLEARFSLVINETKLL